MKGFHQKMKRLSILCLLLCASLLVCACTGGGGEIETTGGVEETTAAPQAEKPTPTPPTGSDQKTYTIKVQTSEGGIEGVRLQACKGEMCLSPVTTNANGIATFKLDKTENITDYHVKIAKFPSGYAGNLAQEYSFSVALTMAGHVIPHHINNSINLLRVNENYLID